MRWDDENNRLIKPEDYPDAGLEDNYCRNPNDDYFSFRAWCVNIDGSRGRIR